MTTGADRPPDDRARWAAGRRATSHDIETGPFEHRQRPPKDVARADALTLCGLDGVRLEERRSLVAGVLDAGVEELPGDATTAGVTTDHEAHDRPDGFVVEGLQDRRMGEPLVVLPWPDADPADRLVPVVRDEPRCAILGGRRVRRSLHGGPMALLAALREVEAADPEVGAPAPFRVAALLEEGGEVGEAFGRQWPDIEGCGHRGDGRPLYLTAAVILEDGACEGG